MMMMMREDEDKEQQQQQQRVALHQLPPGFRFRPSDDMLIKYYLYNKVFGKPLPVLNLIVEKTLYGDKAEEPSQIMAGRAVNEELYFFTLIKKIKVEGKNINRDVAGKGTWKIQKTQNVYDPHNKSNVIGCMKPFKFVGKKKEKAESWVMHEYTLRSYPSSHSHKHPGEWALCRIKSGNDKKKDDKVEDGSPLYITDQSTLERTTEINNDQSNVPENKRMRVSYTSVVLPQTNVPAFDVGGFSRKDQHDQCLPSNVIWMPHQAPDHPQSHQWSLGPFPIHATSINPTIFVGER